MEPIKIDPGAVLFYGMVTVPIFALILQHLPQAPENLPYRQSILIALISVYPATFSLANLGVFLLNPGAFDKMLFVFIGLIVLGFFLFLHIMEKYYHLEFSRILNLYLLILLIAIPVNIIAPILSIIPALIFDPNH